MASSTYNKVSSMQQIQQHMDKVDIAATASVGAMLLSWLPIVTEVLQLVATIIAIASGVMAYKWHRARLRGIDDGSESTEDSESRVSEGDSD